jgi:hypothetical protein
VVGQELLARKLVVAYEGQRHVLTDSRDVITVVSSKGSSSA